MTLRKKLTICFASLSALMLGLGVSSITSISRLSGELDEAQNLTTQKIVKFGSVRSQLLTARLAVRDCMYLGPGKPGEFAECRRMLAESLNGADATIGELRPLLVTEKGKAIVSALATAITRYRTHAAEVLSRVSRSETAEADKIATEELAAAAAAVLKLVDGFMQVQSDYVRNASATSAASTSTARTAGGALLFLGVAVCGVALMVVRRAGMQVAELAHGVTGGANEVTQAARQVAGSATSLSQQTSEHAASIQEVSAAMEELSATTASNTTLDTSDGRRSSSALAVAC